MSQRQHYIKVAVSAVIYVLVLGMISIVEFFLLGSSSDNTMVLRPYVRTLYILFGIILAVYDAIKLDGIKREKITIIPITIAIIIITAFFGIKISDHLQSAIA